jgi:hypothetical protein
MTPPDLYLYLYLYCGVSRDQASGLAVAVAVAVVVELIVNSLTHVLTHLLTHTQQPTRRHQQIGSLTLPPAGYTPIPDQHTCDTSPFE